MGFKKSINRNGGVDLTGPSVDAATDVGDVAETMVFQKGCDLHASTAMVTQTGDGAALVEFCQAIWNGLHGHDHHFATLRRNAGQFAFPCFTHIQHQGLALGASLRQPVLELSGVNLLHESGQINQARFGGS